MSNDEPTIQEVLEAVSDYAAHTDQQIGEIKTEISGIKVEIGGIKTEISSIKNQMVTKSYLDDKLADLRGDLTVLMRKEDTKLKTLVDILTEKKVLSFDDTKRIFSMEPFPQLAL
ncbi:MAG: hypothetical protein HY980_00605 [Candidatus Magasanikbacteria bacterium]|nr:hypothetical protein [Candidatus Magasanikbacteria bacterium]